MNIKEMSITELKALAYDTISQLEITQNNLRLINQEIKNKLDAPCSKPVEVPAEVTPE